MTAASQDGTDFRNRPRSTTDRAERSGTDSSADRRETDELAKVRQSLQNVPELSDQRMSEIKDRIKRGYYGRSDVLQRIAKRLTRHLVR